MDRQLKKKVTDAQGVVGINVCVTYKTRQSTRWLFRIVILH